MNIHKNINLFKYAEHAQNILCKHGVCFSDNGYPDLTGFTYPTTIPDGIEVLPYSKRNQARNPKRTILTFFEADPLLYGYLNSLDKIVANLYLYYGVTGFDLSPCLDFPIEEQNAALLINALTNGLILSHGIKLIPPLRTGGIETVSALKSYPTNICYAFGCLGCNQKLANLGHLLMELKLALCKPSQILAYGNITDADSAIFRKWGVPVMPAIDYQTHNAG